MNTILSTNIKNATIMCAYTKPAEIEINRRFLSYLPYSLRRPFMSSCMPLFPRPTCVAATGRADGAASL
ncbi:hypothetical protein KCP76_00795 [Salmonella enterica subsp. enterica serovar Weltevreden]|nr:hypothetical protein KCP76_00795 [Salmonella enterica subsp. enterica serovar Weltevreden]